MPNPKNAAVDATESAPEDGLSSEPYYPPEPSPGPGALTKAQFIALMSNLNVGRIATRTQSGSKLSYLQAWDVRASLIRVFGFGGFSIEVLKSEVVEVERDVAKASGGTTAFRVTALCTVQLRIPQLGATYSESAMSSQSGAVFGDVGDFAVKTAVSDAMKRCAINLGTQFGLSLYNNGSNRDIIAVVFEPTQSRYLAELAADRPDPTPQHALEGINSADPDMKTGIEVERAPNFLEIAQQAKSTEEVLNAWRSAKGSGAPTSVLEEIIKIGETWRAREEDAVMPADPVEGASEALQKGFGNQS